MLNSIIKIIAGLEQFGKNALRFGIVIVFIWIGGLKYFTYEADGIVPFVANSPFMSFFYNQPDEYKEHINKEGELNTENHEWHIQNNTYGFARGLGLMLVILACLVALHKPFPLLSMAASLLIFVMTLGTLSFLVTT
ncbi:MAG TPA: DUF417 family protein, partial [Mucilaginibacter sp.]